MNSTRFNLLCTPGIDYVVDRVHIRDWSIEVCHSHLLASEFLELISVIEAYKSSLTGYTLYWRPFTHNIRSWWYTQVQLYTGDHNLHPLLATPTFSVLPQPFLLATLKHGNGLGRGRVYSACTSRVIIIVIEHIRSCQKCTALPLVMLCMEAKNNQYTTGKWSWLPKTFMLSVSSVALCMSPIATGRSTKLSKFANLGTEKWSLAVTYSKKFCFEMACYSSISLAGLNINH